MALRFHDTWTWTSYLEIRLGQLYMKNNSNLWSDHILVLSLLYWVLPMRHQLYQRGPKMGGWMTHGCSGLYLTNFPSPAERLEMGLLYRQIATPTCWGPAPVSAAELSKRSPDRSQHTVLLLMRLKSSLRKGTEQALWNLLANPDRYLKPCD